MRRILVFLILVAGILQMHAHKKWQDHRDDMYEVFGFEKNAEITEWMRFINSDMIDKFNFDSAYTYKSQRLGFYDYLKAKYPPFKCNHRLLFHWGYNAKPWSDELQAKVDSYGWSEEKAQSFRQEFVNEQKRRNRMANARTETLFGFASGGKEAALARALISLAYDTHLLGDYTPDNKDLNGLCSFSSIIGDIVNNLRVIDHENTKALVSAIQKASRTSDPDPIKAEKILKLLKKDLRKILRQHKDSRIRSLITPAEYE